MISLFGHYFMALDWDYDKERLYGFESFRDRETYIDIITALPDNSKVLLYQSSKRKLYSLSRQKMYGQYDKVREEWQQVKLISNTK